MIMKISEGFYIMEEKKKNTKTNSLSKPNQKKASTTKKDVSTTAKKTENTNKMNGKTSSLSKPNQKKASTSKKTSSNTTKKVESTSKTKEKKTASSIKKETSSSKKQSSSKTASKKAFPETIEEGNKTSKKRNVKTEREEKYVISETIPQEIEMPISEVEMEEKKDLEQKYEIPIANYFIAIIAIIWVFVIAFLGFHLYKTHQEALYQEGYFNHKGNVKKTTLDEVQKLMENKKEESLFLLFNYHKEKEHYELEEKLAQIIQDYHLENQFYYIDITDYKVIDNCDISCALKKEFEIDEIQNLPAIFYIKDKKVIDIAKREDKQVLEASDFVKILDMYEFKK